MNLNIPTRDVDYILENECIVIDVRSESEFEEYHIPGSINIPIFNNKEREYIGTLYKRSSIDQALEEGLRVSSQKLHSFYVELKKYINLNKEIIVTCHRGGLRSRTIVISMLLVNLQVRQLEGGIKSFRTKISSTFDLLKSCEYKFLVIEGMTGTNKTKLIESLENKGYPTLNLEKLARNRGSIFGHVGIKPTSQKQFEVELFFRFKEISNSEIIIIEAESKRIGNIILPEWILLGKESAKRLQIQTSLNTRVENILKEYNYDRYKDNLNEAYTKLKKRLPKEISNITDELLSKGQIFEFVRILLSEYYDPRYQYTSNKYNSISETLVYESFDELLQKAEQIIIKEFYSQTY